MQRRHCEVGSALDSEYTGKILAWVEAETRKRSACRVASESEWFTVAERAERARWEHEQARRVYVDHVIACPVCDAHVFALSQSNASEGLSPAGLRRTGPQLSMTTPHA